MITEHDQVVLARPLAEHRLEAGDVGTVVMVHEDGKGFTVEFMTLDGETLAVVTLTADAVRPVAKREMVHARAVA